MIRKDYYMPEPLVRKLEKLAREMDVSAAELVRRAVEEYLERKT